MKRLICINCLIALMVACSLAGCKKQSGQPANKPAANAAAKEDRSAPVVITITPKNPAVKPGQALTLTGILSHIPEDQNRWYVSVGWKSSDGQRDAQALKNEDGKYLNTAEFTWTEPGTYTVTLSYYGSGNKVFADQTATVTVR